jgi:hypothetical protein
MDINLDELMAIQSALINVKMYLSQEIKTDPNKLKKIVDEAYEIVMKKIDSLQQPYHL